MHLQSYKVSPNSAAAAELLYPTGMFSSFALFKLAGPAFSSRHAGDKDMKGKKAYKVR
jgi:hypothetical protein